MKNKFKIYFGLAFVTLFLVDSAFAGNKDRTGQAGAPQLLINPWAKSSGFANANVASVRGLEASYLNIAGMAFTKKTEIVFSNTSYLQGTDIKINSFGLSQKVGKEGAGGVIGLSVMSMTFGDIMITTPDLPEGGLGNFTPNFLNIGVSYAKVFSNSIYGGINFKVVSESINNLKGTGLAIDAGIQYVTGEQENIKFGISLKNVGTPIKYSGDGNSFRGTVPGASSNMTVEQRSQAYELPSLLNIGAAYDFNFSEKYRLSVAGNFTSNSFTRDLICAGLEFAWKDLFMIRGGYAYEKGITNKYESTPSETFLSGPTAGMTLKIPLNKEAGSHFDIDYSYRATNIYNGIHSIGARINL